MMPRTLSGDGSKEREPRITESILSGKRVIPGVPPNPLPTWVKLPLEAKLPMIPGPKGTVVLSTTNLGEKIHMSSRDLGFDLTDPYSLLMSNNYKPLHDPHLKLHLNAPGMRKRLQEAGFINKDGKVVCTLKEFNEYRQYLRKIYLRQDTEKEENRRSGPKQRRPSKESPYGSHMTRIREEKVKEVRKRLEKQQEDDRTKFAKLMREEEERRRRLREEQLAKLCEKGTTIRSKRELRLANIRQRQIEERDRKMEVLRRWFEEDHERSRRADERRRGRELERQRKLEENWEQRKLTQKARLHHEMKSREEAEKMKKKSIEARERMLKKQRDRQQNILMRMMTQRRHEKERLEQDYKKKFFEKMEKRREKQGKHKRRRAKVPPRQRSPMKSTWDLEKVLLDTFPPHAEHLPASSSHSFNCARRMEFLPLLEEQLRQEARAEEEIQRTLSALGLADFRGATFSPGVIRQTSAPKVTPPSVPEFDLTQLGLGDFRGAKFVPDIFGPESEPSLEEIILEEEVEKAPALDVLGLGEFHGCNIKLTPSTIDLLDRKEDVNPALSQLCSEMKKKKKGIKVAFEEPKLCYRYHRPPPPEEEILLENTARDIVHATMEIATKVIFPACMTYLKTSDPELYMKYSRPVTPLPDEELQLQDMSEDDDIDGEAVNAYKQRGVRFSMIEETIAPPDMSESELQKWLSEAVELREDDGEYSDDYEDFLEEDEDDTSYNGMKKTSSLMARVTGRDSVTMVQQRRASLSQPGDMDYMLSTLIDAFDTGRLNPRQMEQLLDFAKGIISVRSECPGSPDDVGLSPSSLESLLEGRSNTSLLAARVVEDTLAKLQTQLFSDSEPEVQLDWKETPTYSTDSVSRLSDFLTREALSLASASLQELTSDSAQKMTSQCAEENQTKPQEDSITEVPVEDSVSKTASLLISQTLETVCCQLQSPCQRSATSLFVQEVLEKVADKVTRKDILQLDWTRTVPLKSRSDCISPSSLVVRDALQKVVGEMETEIGSRGTELKSAESMFVEDLVRDTLMACLNEARSGKLTQEQRLAIVSAAMNTPRQLTWQHVVESIKSDPVLFDTNSFGSLSRDQILRSASSMMVEALVRETLVNVQQEINEGKIEEDKVNHLAQSITSNSNMQTVTRIKSAESSVAEGIVLQTIAGVLAEIDGRYDSPIRVDDNSENMVELEANQSNISVPSDQKKGPFRRFSDAVLGVFKRSSSTSSSLGQKTSAESSQSDARTTSKTADDSEETQVDDEEIITSPAVQLVPIDTEVPVSADVEKTDISKREEEFQKKYGQEEGRSVVVTLTDIPDHIHPSTVIVESDSDSDEELGIHPVANGKSLDVDAHLVGKALSALSNRDPVNIKAPCDPTERFSYRDLFHPDIAKVKTLHAESDESLKNQLVNASHRNVVLHKHPSELAGVVAPEDHKEEEIYHNNLENDVGEPEPIDSVLSVTLINSGTPLHTRAKPSPCVSKTQSLGDSQSAHTVKNPLRAASENTVNGTKYGKGGAKSTSSSNTPKAGSNKTSATMSPLARCSVTNRHSQKDTEVKRGKSQGNSPSKTSRKNSANSVKDKSSEQAVSKASSATRNPPKASNNVDTSAGNDTNQNDSRLTLLHQVAERLSSQTADREPDTGQSASKSSTTDTPLNSRSSKSGSSTVKSAGSKRSSKSPSVESTGSVKSKTKIADSPKGKLSGSSSPTKRYSKTESATSSSAKSSENTIKAYSSGSTSPVKLSRKNSSPSKTSLKQKKSNESIGSMKSLGQKKEIVEENKETAPDTTVNEIEAPAVEASSKQSLPKRPLPASLVQVTQIPGSFSTEETDNLSGRGSVTSLDSTKGSHKRMDLAPRPSNGFISRRSVHGILHSPQRSHGIMAKGEPPLKCAVSDTRAREQRRHSIGREPAAEISVTSLPKVFDSQGNFLSNLQDLSAKTSTASAPDAVAEDITQPPSQQTLGSRTSDSLK